MTKVYVLLCGIAYEGSSIEAIYENEEDPLAIAEEKNSKLRAEKNDSSCWYEVETWEVLKNNVEPPERDK